ncbi:hypothetical protein HY605_02725 [Candidatus Peregrinibacteria bacterium]|nr:hypothetical protein [Candidatus Peregrinibacteria bacterium]
MKKKVLFALVLSILAFSACSDKANDQKTPDTDQAAETPKEEVKNPLNFPDVKTDAKAGEMVLTVDPKDLDEAMNNDPKDSDYLYFYSAEMVEPGDVQSKVKVGVAEFKVHNSLIIPIAKGQSAEAGEIVLVGNKTFYMERALVKEGGESLKVVSIDGFDSETEVETGMFNVLKEEWSPGTSVACPNDYDGYDLATVITVGGGKVLTTGWAGVMAVSEESKCKPVPIWPEIAVGDQVFIAPFATFEPGTVTKVDLEKGRIMATYDFGGDTEEEEFPIGDILLEL